MDAAKAKSSVDPRRYFEAVAARRERTAEADPVCLYLEVTNRCNLLCETCPRTFEDAGAAGRHELVAVHPHRRPVSRTLRGSCCTAWASRCW